MNGAAQCDRDFVGSMRDLAFDGPCISPCTPGVHL
jgi:hypothetical protein